MRYLFILLVVYFGLFAQDKTPSDVYSESIVLKEMLVELRKEGGITTALKDVSKQHNKSPRHVLQKTLEILSKVNKYREINSYGEITVPPVPSRDITPQDVYHNVKRLKVEVAFLLKNKKVLDSKRFKAKKYEYKTPSDVYRELWIVSLAFDELLGQGFTPSDVYMQTQQVIEGIKFLRSTQRELQSVKVPELKENQHPNHALYMSVELLRQLSKIQKKLWMDSLPIPVVEQKVISPTEVYDSLQTVTAELNRILRRLGVERSFRVKKIKDKKTPADVVQNLEYAIALLPTFEFNKNLNQYPKISLKKTPNDVYALSEFILAKIELMKDIKGIRVEAKQTTYIYGLKPIHVYAKAIESLEKVSKLKELEGFRPSQNPMSPNTKITPSEVYELILRLDDELNLVYSNVEKINDENHLESYRELINKKHYKDKTSSDVYDNLWKISYELDAILNIDYTPNETYVLAKKIENDIKSITEYFLKRPVNLEIKFNSSKKPNDVLEESLKLLDTLQNIKNRGNFGSVKTTIPKDKIITPTSVYNALRIVSATISEIHVFYGIEEDDNEDENLVKAVENKTPSDVYSVVELSNRILSVALKDSSYED